MPRRFLGRLLALWMKGRVWDWMSRRGDPMDCGIIIDCTAVAKGRALEKEEGGPSRRARWDIRSRGPLRWNEELALGVVAARLGGTPEKVQRAVVGQVEG